MPNGSASVRHSDVPTAVLGVVRDRWSRTTPKAIGRSFAQRRRKCRVQRRIAVLGVVPDRWSRTTLKLQWEVRLLNGSASVRHSDLPTAVLGVVRDRGSRTTPKHSVGMALGPEPPIREHTLPHPTLPCPSKHARPPTPAHIHPHTHTQIHTHDLKGPSQKSSGVMYSEV